MSWWTRKPDEQRARWVLDPLAGVGPLRFGMGPDQVKAALDGAVPSVAQSSQSRLRWQRYSEVGVTAIYGPGPVLVAVAVDALSGPQVRLEEVELIARVPSRARADIHELARRVGASVRVNWSGDPEVAAWGLSMGAAQDRGLSPDGYAERGDAVITDALLVCAELAEDPYATAPVVQWHDIRDVETNSGSWPVASDRDRPRWDWTPLEQVGPLRFGMTPHQVAAALHGEVPVGRRGGHPWSRQKAGRWHLREERFDEAGVSAHYWSQAGVPTLAAVTVRGRSGPQVAWDGIPLIGRRVSEVDAEVVRRIEDRGLGWLVHCDGGPGPEELNMSVRATRAGDTVISEARFFAPDWENHG
ncbi:hypothetical protein WJM95_33605 [Streptomyces sp. f51]|uniref:hypothetical protein n=1 Tax=Streptomyces sp. f51 TaxID=1827742 RepID=UPI0030CF5E0F